MTNAAKYGALSVARGRLAVDWSLEPAPCGNSRLRFTWRETNGPPVSPPKREGFGSRLIRRSIEGELAGEVSLRFPATGAVCEIVIPLAIEAKSKPLLAMAG